MSDFAEIKSRVSMPQVAEMYGFNVKDGFIVCPFHTDTHPSCKVYGEARGWYCFTCGEGGTVIDFVMRYFNLSALDAAKKLDNDFHLSVFDGQYDKQAAEKARQKREEAERQRRKAAEEYRAKNNEYREIFLTLKNNPPKTHEQAQLYARLKSRSDTLDDWLYAHKEVADYG